MNDLVALEETERTREQRAIAAALTASGVHDFALVDCSILLAL